jgi:VanZ family protein
VLPVYAGALETLQLLVPGRGARLIDASAGALGTWAGIRIALLLHWLIMRPGAQA